MNLGNAKLGILGGGQLGKMLLSECMKWGITTHVLDPDNNCPAAKNCDHYVKGDFKNYDDVYAFGQNVDIITIEIENVNTKALLQLKKEGKKIFPQPEKIDIIKDKGLQKEFYIKNSIPTSSFVLYHNKENILEAINSGKQKTPFVQKSRKAGYDGKGVSVIKNKSNLHLLLDGECLVEELVEIKKEISVIVARNEKNEIIAYPPVEMIFNPHANLVENLISPARIDESTAKKATEIAIAVIEKLNLVGLLAVEMFLDNNNTLFINEVAPRPHNSGHQTIENSYTSQYEQHLRAIFNLPLGSTKIICPAVMLNLLGEPNYSGLAIYQGINECLKIEGVNIHLYGKKETRPYRKMGHVTIIDDTIEKALIKSQIVQQTLKVIA